MTNKPACPVCGRPYSPDEATCQECGWELQGAYELVPDTAEVQLRYERDLAQARLNYRERQVQQAQMQLADVESELKNAQAYTAQVEEAQAQIAKLESELKDSQVQTDKVVDKLREAQAQIAKLESELKDSQVQTDKVVDKLKEAQAQIAKLESELKDSQVQTDKADGHYGNTINDFIILDNYPAVEVDTPGKIDDVNQVLKIYEIREAYRIILPIPPIPTVYLNNPLASEFLWDQVVKIEKKSRTLSLQLAQKESYISELKEEIAKLKHQKLVNSLLPILFLILVGIGTNLFTSDQNQMVGFILLCIGASGQIVIILIPYINKR